MNPRQILVEATIVAMMKAAGRTLWIAELHAQQGDRNAERIYACRARKMVRIGIRWYRIELERARTRGAA